MDKQQRAKELLRRLKELKKQLPSKGASIMDDLMGELSSSVSRQIADGPIPKKLEELELKLANLEHVDVPTLSKSFEEANQKNTDSFSEYSAGMEARLEELVKKFEDADKSSDENNAVELTKLLTDLDEFRGEFASEKQQSANRSSLIEAEVSRVTQLFGKLEGEFATKQSLETVVTTSLTAQNNATEELKKLIQDLEQSTQSRISSILNTRGGNMNRNVAIDGNTSVLSRYTDINLKAGNNVALSYVYNDTTKYTDVTVSATGGSGSVIANAAGQNTQVQFNDGGLFGASSTFTWDKNASVLTANNYVGSMLTILETSSSILVVGQTTANPAFAVDTSASVQTTGIRVVGAASGNGATIQTTSSGVNENLTIGAKGGGNVALGTAGNSPIILSPNGQTRLSLTTAVVSFGNMSNSNAAASARFGFTGAADTALTLSTEAPSTYFNLGQTRNHATGSIQTQRDFRITGTNHSFTAASSILNAAAFSVDGPDTAAANATITNSHAFYIPPSSVSSGVASSFGITANAATGGLSNYAGKFLGDVMLSGAIVDSASVAGTVGQYLRSTGTGTIWASVVATGGNGINRSINNIAANTSVAAAASTDYVYFAAGTIAVNLPTPIGNTNMYTIKNTGAGTVTIDTTVAHTIDGSPTAVIPVQYTSLDIISNGSDWLIT